MEPTYEDLSPDLIRARLSSDTRTWLRELRVHREIDSTNNHLMSRSLGENVDGVVCLAEWQTNGRGRRGRTWLTPARAGIALSLGRRVRLSIADVAPLSLVVGVAVARAMHRSGIAGVSLKWPNDVLLDGAKVGGVLIELASAGNPVVAVVGVGVNVGSGAEVSARLGIPVGDVLDKNGHVSRNRLAADIIDSVHVLATAFESTGFSEIREEWERLHAYQGERVRLTSAESTVEGIARGINANGELVLETPSGVRHFSAGEVSLRVAPP
jgi:BirA family transcriptional regulator, biotin operon repressor / biotin---[acetyl-CoA-carboxylase] ligase